MKLSFHGASYEYHPSEVKVTEEEVGGRYRGLPWKVHCSKQQYKRKPSSVEFVYRGVYYKKQ